MMGLSLRRSVGFVLSWVVLAAAAAPPPARLFFETPALGDARLSPDGSHLALRVAAKDSLARLVVLDLKTMVPQDVASFREGDVGYFDWVNDSRLVFKLSPPLVGPNLVEVGPGLFAVNADGSGFRQLVETTGSFVKSADSAPEGLPWGTSLLHTMGSSSGNDVFVIRPEEVSKQKIDYFKLQRLNTVTGKAVDVDTPLHSRGWTLDARGELRAVLTGERDRKAVHLRDAAGAWKQIAEFDMMAAEGIRPRFVGPDGQLYVEARQGDKEALFTLEAGTGQLAKTPVASSRDFDLHPDFIIRNDRLAGLRYVIDAEVTQWIDPEMKAMQATIDDLLPVTANRLTPPRRGDSPFVLVQAWSDRQPLLTYLYNTGTKKLSRVGSSRPGVDPQLMGRTAFIRFKARDGLEIPAYLTLPAGGEKKNLPMVVLVHGGPWVRGETWGWDPEVQFLASRGYAVLQPEFRGSTGYGGKLFSAGFKQWGRAMQDDVADAARWAIAQGTADPKRICIAGASYGGYATLMGLVKDADLFRCGVSWAGVTDIGLMYTVAWSDMRDDYKQYGMPRLIGDQVADAEMLKSVSPLAQAAKITRPLLLAHGAWDVRVPIVHSEKFLEAVKPHNANVEWVVYGNEGHGWDRLENKLDFWGRVENFLARNLMPQ